MSEKQKGEEPTNITEEQQPQTMEQEIAGLKGSIANIAQVINNIGNAIEKTELRLKLLEQSEGINSDKFKDSLADAVVEKMVNYDKENS
tara:strand:- start:1260 stop:1526 length:267 start_codon:yes stop_codon:yes gene_type:complete